MCQLGAFNVNGGLVTLVAVFTALSFTRVAEVQAFKRARTTAPAAQPARPPEQKPKSPAHELVGNALFGELAGDNEVRDAYLRDALKRDPASTAARWHSGQVSVDGRWLSIDDAVERSDDKELLHEYRNRRLPLDGSPNAHLALADWCKQVGLTEQRRAHLLAVFAEEPRNLALMKELGIEEVNGQFVSTDAFYAHEHARKLRELGAKRWWSKIEPLREPLMLGSGPKYEQARQQLIALQEPEAIPLMERMLSTESETVALAVVDALGEMP
jgi:hypothetical protein